MGSFYADNDDLRFYVEEGIDWGPLLESTRFGAGAEGVPPLDESVSTWRDVLEMVGTFAAEEIAPHAAEIDRTPMRLVDGEVVFPTQLQTIFDQIAGLGLHGLCVPTDLGGMNCPLLLYLFTAEMFARADVSVMTHHGFHGGIAMALLMYSAMEGTTTIDKREGRIVATRFSGPIADMISGNAWGSMDITEPNAGSDMGALRVVGEQDADGSWFVSGQKIFVTSGHGRYHIVIARTERDEHGWKPGLEALSLFLVETFTVDEGGRRRRLATIERVEEKLGHHGSATVSVNFDHTPAQLIGKRGEGFRQMLLLMNNARISVGFESLGLCEAAWRMARTYAAVRESMGKTINKHEIIADYLDEMESDIQGIRALAVHAAYHEELSQREQLRLKYLMDERDPEHAALSRKVDKMRWASRRVTPLIKFIAAEKAVEMARRAIQIHGGFGYTTEYGAEKLLRDALVLPIYEGTSQIQALMATKDNLLWIMKNPKAFARELADTSWRGRFSADPLERGAARLRNHALTAQAALMTRVAKGKLGQADGWSPTALKAAFADWDPKTDFAPALLHAERLTWLLVDAAVAEVLLEQATKHPKRRPLLAKWIERAEPRARHNLDLIRSTGDRLLAELGGGSAGVSP